MNARLLFIGIDVDEKNFNCFVLEDGKEDGRWFRTSPNLRSLLSVLNTEIKEGASLHFCYESSYAGFFLCRELQKAGHECSVIASSLIPKMAGERVKNDRLDAEKLARYFAKNLLVPVHVPTEQDEQERAVIRSREFIKGQHKQIKRHIISMCKMLGWEYAHDRGSNARSYWTVDYRKWLNEKIKCASPAVRINVDILLSQLHHTEVQLEHYQRIIEELAQSEKYRRRVESLICYRGIKALTAMTLITEIGDINRFAHPKKLFSYAGLDVSEHSSGGKERRFSITKAGNKRLRTALTEAVQGCEKRVIRSSTINKRREKIERKYIEVADRCALRLQKKAMHLILKGKPRNKVKTACAREFLGFVWESMRLTN
jgi:transposase